MSQELIQIKVTTPLKLSMLAMLLVSLILSWFVGRWFLGNTIAENLPSDPQQLSTAEMAVRMAPMDPLTHWRLGALIQRELHSDQIPRAVTEFEQAVRFAPNDYRLWMELGAALEQAGEKEKGEKALRTAVKLAPAYAYPRWLLGNLLVRDGRYPEAFAELRRASEANDKFQQQLFNLAWHVNKDDFESLKTAIGDTPSAKAQFAQYLVARGRFDEGLRLWSTLGEADKKFNRKAAEAIIVSLATGKRFHQAVGIWNDVAPTASYRAQIGQFVDGGYEDDVINAPGVLFGWQLPSVAQMQLTVDKNQGHSGHASLKLNFEVRNRLEAIGVSQLVPVAPDTQYDFECYFKTEKLVSAATPIILFSDLDNDAVLVTSQPLPTDDNDWQRLTLSFKTGPKTEAVRFLINRAKCDADSPVCPIYGTVWYDDFNLKARK